MKYQKVENNSNCIGLFTIRYELYCNYNIAVIIALTEKKKAMKMVLFFARDTYRQLCIHEQKAKLHSSFLISASGNGRWNAQHW